MSTPQPEALSGTRSYVVPCATEFRDAIQRLATRRGASVADLARAVMLLVDDAFLTAYPDPGEPERGDREVVVVKSGQSKDRRLRRKPRLQVRLRAGLGQPEIRKALALALAMDRGERTVRVEDPSDSLESQMDQASSELDRLRLVIDAISFEPLREGVLTRSDALYVLGFPPHSKPDGVLVKEKFRLLAKIHHPDGALGDHLRMAQLNEAVKILKTGGF